MPHGHYGTLPSGVPNCRCPCLAPSLHTHAQTTRRFTPRPTCYLPQFVPTHLDHVLHSSRLQFPLTFYDCHVTHSRTVSPLLPGLTIGGQRYDHNPTTRAVAFTFTAPLRHFAAAPPARPPVLLAFPLPTPVTCVPRHATLRCPRYWTCGAIPRLPDIPPQRFPHPIC